MWARHIEAVIGAWLGLSWLIFRYQAGLTSIRINDGICAGLIIIFSLITYMDRFRYCHLMNFFMGAWLIAWAVYYGKGIYFAPHQNYMVAGFLLMMLSLVPSRTKEPPRAWIEYLSKMREQ